MPHDVQALMAALIRAEGPVRSAAVQAAYAAISDGVWSTAEAPPLADAAWGCSFIDHFPVASPSFEDGPRLTVGRLIPADTH